MNKEELQNKICEVEKMLCELKEELEDMEEKEAEKGKIWKPGYNEVYWHTNCNGEIYEEINTNEEYDKVIMKFGNCYPTKEKAEFEANREKYTRLFRRYVERHSEPLDWENDDQLKYYVFCDCTDNDLSFDFNRCYRLPFVIYASSKEVLQDAIDFIGEKNFLEFVLEVKE